MTAFKAGLIQTNVSNEIAENVASLREQLAERPADEPGAAGDQDAHRMSSRPDSDPSAGSRKAATDTPRSRPGPRQALGRRAAIACGPVRAAEPLPGPGPLGIGTGERRTARIPRRSKQHEEPP